jgi:hypothetical protein
MTNCLLIIRTWVLRTSEFKRVDTVQAIDNDIIILNSLLSIMPNFNRFFETGDKATAGCRSEVFNCLQCS